MTIRRLCILAAAVAGLWLLAGCAPFVDAAQPAMGGVTVAGARLGQTLVAQHDGLSGIDVALARATQPVTLTLRAEPGAETVAVAPGRAVDGPWQRFAFPALADSHGGRYALELSAAGPLAVSAGPADAYLDGALYADGEPQEAQLPFRLVYDPARVAWGLAAWLASGLWPGLVCLALLFLPGLALLAWLWPAGGAAGRFETLILAATCSLSAYPLLMLAARLAGARLGPGAAWSVLAAAAVALAARLALSPELRRAARGALARPRGAADWAWLAAAALIVGLVVLVRLIVVRSVQVPLFGDSVEHTEIVQLMLDNGGLFSSWQPYAAFQSFTVHFGFHSMAAWFAWLTGAGASRAVVLAGQVWNVVAVLALYPLAGRVSGGGAEGRWAGLAAVLVAGLVSATPMFYVNWGRYAQLAGLALLPGAILLLWHAVDAPRPHPGRIILAAIALAGTFLAYYRTAFFYAVFVAVWLALVLASRLRLDGRRWLDALVRVAGIGLLAVLLIAPHLVALTRGYLDEKVATTTSYGAGLTLDQVMLGYQEWRTVPQYISAGLLALAGAALVWSLARRDWLPVAVGLWGAILAGLNLAQLVGLPGAMLISHFSVMISLYVPVAVLIGWLVGQATGRLGRGRAAWGLAALLGVVALAGAAGRVRSPSGDFVLVTRPDQEAMQWVAAHVPVDAVFLVNGFTIYSGTSAVGSDAGWWMPLLARRQNTMPPQYPLFDEVPIEPGYPQDVAALVRQWEGAPFSAEAWAAACRLGVTHVYVGQRQGRVGIPAPRPLFAPADLLASPAVEVIYHRDRVWIAQLKAGTCPD